MVIQAKRRRFALAVVVALVLAAVVSAAAQVLLPSGCKSFTPADWEWWARQCYLYSFTDTASQPRVTGFVVR